MKTVLITVFCIVFSNTGFGQQAVDHRERIQQEKMAFFNKELKLTKAEEKAFWPLYNDYQNRKDKIIAEKRTLIRYYNQNERNINDVEIADILQRYINLEKEETQLLETYTENFRDIMPDEKVLKIFLAEIRFKDYLLKKLRTNQ